MVLPFVNNAQYGFDTTTVYFDIGKSHLDKKSTSTLDSINDIIQRENRVILIFGYADYLGAELLSDRLSEQRASRVKEYLLHHKIPANLILQSSGVGQIDVRGNEQHGNQIYRRVDVFIKRKSFDSAFVGVPIEDSINTISHDVTLDTEIENISIDQLKVNDVFVLKNIEFYESRSTIIPTSVSVLNSLLKIMKDHPSLIIRLEGHICCQVDYNDAYDMDENNSRLSVNRARKIYEFLIRNGIEKNRMDYAGFGRKRPLFPDEKTKEEAQRNRRVEVRILGK